MMPALDFFMPIFSFLFVFVLVYALLKKTQILGENNFVCLLVSFLLAVFFIGEVSLVDFVKFSSAWFVVFLVCVFLILVLVSFTTGKLEAFTKPAVAWGLVAGLIVFFIISSAYTFHWAVNWEVVWSWFYTDWAAFFLLLLIAGIVAKVLTWKIKK